MHRWLLGFFVLFAALGWMVLSGLVHLAADVVKLVAYGAFGLSILFLALGYFAYNKVKGGLGSQS